MFGFKYYFDGTSLRRAIIVIILFLLAWMCAGFIKPAFCHPATVRDVVSMRFISSTHLNITVWHDIETSLHYVDTIEVTWGTNITSLTLGPQPLAPDGTFTVDYNMGPVSGTPTITIRARCTFTSYSGATSWTGTIPETTPSPSPSPSPTPSPTATPTPTPTSSPTPTISPSPSLSPTETPSPSPEPTQSPEPQPEPFPTTLVMAAASVVVLVGIGLLVYFKKLRK